MRKIFALLTLALLIFSSVCTAAAKSPPFEVTVNEMVPGDSEAGNYAKYTVNIEIKIYAAPRNNRVIGTFQAGDFVRKTSSVTYAYPAAHAVKILRTFNAATSPKGEFRTTLNEGDFVYLLMPLRRGYLGWYNGGHVWNLSAENIKNFITPNAKSAWGEYQGEPTDLNLGVEVWEFLEREDGLKGWALTWKDGTALNNLDRRN